MSVGTPVLDALEAFYSAPVEDISDSLASKLADARSRDDPLPTILGHLRCAEFLELYLHQTQQIPPGDWLEGLDQKPGTVRASIVGRELSTLGGVKRRSMIIDGEHLGGEHLPLKGLPPAQVKAALCYANDVTIEDPFDEEQVLGDFVRDVVDSMPHVQVQIAPDPDHFVSTIQALAGLAPVVRAGHIVFVPRRLAMDTRMAGRFASNAWETFGAQRQELALRSLRLWIASGGVITPLFGSDDEEQAFKDEAGLLSPLTETADSLRVQRLARLALPSAGRLEPRQMVLIREDDAFESFRATQRRALASLAEGSSSELADYRLEMAQAARELGRSVGSRPSLNSLFSKALGWSVGAMVLPPHGWQAAAAALGGITTQVAAERALSTEKDSRRALRHHFATLAGPG